jgi:hypothetical protein
MGLCKRVLVVVVGRRACTLPRHRHSSSSIAANARQTPGEYVPFLVELVRACNVSYQRTFKRGSTFKRFPSMPSPTPAWALMPPIISSLSTKIHR